MKKDWGKGISGGQKLLFAGALLCFLYFAGLGIYLGAIYLFQWFWALLGGLLAAVGLLLPRWSALPRWFRILWKIGVFSGIGLFLVVEGLIFSAMTDQPEPGADYVVVLGAKVNGTTPSLSLHYRIQAARDYLEENPDTMVIASGGQGPNEGISEAKAIENSLLAMGIGQERILLEDQSTSTNENLAFSKEKMEALGDSVQEARVVVVSTDFHIFRAKAIARNYGYEKVEGKGARSVPGLQPHYCTREFFAILNDFRKGNLK